METNLDIIFFTDKRTPASGMQNNHNLNYTQFNIKYLRIK